MGNKNVIEVYADYIYYIPIGDKDKIDYIKNILTETAVDKYVEYLSLKTIIPLAHHKEILEKQKQYVIQLDPIVEEAQAYAFSHYDIHCSYMLICLKYIDGCYILIPPKFLIIDGNNPEKGLAKELSRLSDRKLDDLLANTIKPIAIIGPRKDTVLYISKLTNKKIISNENIDKFLKLLTNGVS